MSSASSDNPSSAADHVERRGNAVDVARALISERRDEALLELVVKLVARNSDLERRLSTLLSRGNKSERVSKAQLRLFLDALGAANDETLDALNDALRAASGIDDKDGEGDEDAPKTKTRQPRLRRPIPANLRRVDNEIKVPQPQRPCPICGAERVCIGHDVTEVIELVPAEVIVRVDRREKLACEPCEGEVVRAPTGDKVVSGGRLGSTLVSQLLVDKYRDGLPLHRQKQRFKRLGIDLAISTLADQVLWTTDLLRPLWRVATAQVLRATVMHLDATSLAVLDRKASGGKKLGALWGYVGDRDVAAVLFACTAKKKGQRPDELGPEDVLALRTGYVVADAANLFDKSFERDDLTECGCNMHARRYFVKALDRGDARAALPVAAFKKLYKIEREIKALDPEKKRDARQQQSKPVYDDLVTWCEGHKPHEPPASPLGTAIRYLTNHQVALRRFLDNGVIPIDNGIVERLHVRTALTRKNYLFAGSYAGGERAAIAYTILACCELAGVNPVDYLADVLPRLNRRMRLRDAAALMPARWNATRQAQTDGE